MAGRWMRKLTTNEHEFSRMNSDHSCPFVFIRGQEFFQELFIAELRLTGEGRSRRAERARRGGQRRVELRRQVGEIRQTDRAAVIEIALSIVPRLIEVGGQESEV